MFQKTEACYVTMCCNIYLNRKCPCPTFTVVTVQENALTEHVSLCV